MPMNHPLAEQTTVSTEALKKKNHAAAGAMATAFGTMLQVS